LYVIVVYDCGVERLNQVRKYLRTYLNRVQNSVFEGELSEAKLARMKAGLVKKLDLAEDSVLIWTSRDPRWLEREALGRAVPSTDNIL
jgi:CRISPR-associated protein Cas2